MSQDNSNDDSNAEEPHPIEHALDEFLHATRDIETCAKIFTPLSEAILSREIHRTGKRIDALLEEVASDDQKTRTEAQADFDRHYARFIRLQSSNMPYQLEKSLFVGLFTCYDAYIGKLTKAVFSKNPKLFNQIDRSVRFGQIMEAPDIQKLKEVVLDEFVSDIRRKSYEDQFTSFESYFAISSLRKFDNYSTFIESSQRRHLFTHCEGIVSNQYLSCCKSAGYAFEVKPKIGEVLQLGPEYFLRSCHVVAEVGVKLAHTVWRKQFPDELRLADKHLCDSIYEMLRAERWGQAITFGEFAIKQPKISDREREKMFLVNYCIALKFGGNPQAAKDMLEAVDWSDSASDFELAKAVLLDRPEEACELMKLIGKAGKLISEHAYHTWPLFREFRSNEEFRKTYESIYGYSFVDEMKREAQKTNAQKNEDESSDDSVPEGTS